MRNHHTVSHFNNRIELQKTAMSTFMYHDLPIKAGDYYWMAFSWLVVWNMFHVFIQLEMSSSSQVTKSYFFRGVGFNSTNQIHVKSLFHSHKFHSYAHLSALIGYKWDSTFYKWGVLSTSHWYFGPKLHGWKIYRNIDRKIWVETANHSSGPSHTSYKY